MLAVSVILPIYNNEGTLSELIERLKEVLEKEGLTYEMLLVNDGSIDGSSALMEKWAKKDAAIRPIHLENNGGQHRAVLKGIELSTGATIVCLDADLQDLPEEIPQLFEKLQAPYEAVFAGRCGKYESSGRLFTSKVFKFLLHALCGVPKDAGMFFVMSRTMANCVLKIPMKKPFVVAMMGLTGLETLSVPILRKKREVGISMYTSSKRLRIGLSAISQVFIQKLKSKVP